MTPHSQEAPVVKFFCIGDEDAVRGFRLAGVDGQAVSTPTEATAALDAAVRRPDIAVVIIVDAIAQGIRDRVDRVRFECERPLLVEVPGPRGPLAGRKTLRELVQEAVGIRLGQGDQHE